jgi:signal transduction histidine kinase
METKENHTDSNETGEATATPTEQLPNREGGPLQNILDRISTGVIILNYTNRTVLFSNDYFNALVPRQKSEDILSRIFDYINQNIGSQKRLDLSQDLVIKAMGKEFFFSFTTYRVGEEIFVVLLDEASPGTIYYQTKQENLYYNKLSELIAEMVHEIGNPLSGITTSLEVVLHNISQWPLEKVKDYIERTINEINRLSEFLGRMREMSEEDKLNIKPISLKETLDRVLLQNEGLLQQKGITCKNLTREGVVVSIDEGAFHQIMFNLINNSLHILTRGKEIKIYVEEIDEFYVKLIYRNNGEAIPEELMGKIFSPLYTSKAKRKGIGLAISLRLMTRMGGTIKAVPPEDSQGAKFVLYVPNSRRGIKGNEKK